jgi:hypothetical protein
MKAYTIQKIDTNLYIKGFSGQLVYSALCGIVPLFFAYLYRLNKIQKKYGHAGWGKKKIARQLPEFITIKKRFLR